MADREEPERICLQFTGGLGRICRYEIVEKALRSRLVFYVRKILACFLVKIVPPGWPSESPPGERSDILMGRSAHEMDELAPGHSPRISWVSVVAVRSAWEMLCHQFERAFAVGSSPPSATAKVSCVNRPEIAMEIASTSPAPAAVRDKRARRINIFLLPLETEVDRPIYPNQESLPRQYDTVIGGTELIE